ncbi:hypothetical protein D3A87_17440 [Vibrio cholerae]|uniref:hypothetical protein n=1 Tax=Vibrio cholerae TaxID=666 RepID=UPI001E49325C|nr:hypothetical protein [Vibrio cholerae]MCD1171503.1 hypothetical protein [Vibrio cholerae]MCD1189331.1 hypothetical protein [Vibrio cholerae]HDZ9134306.1 hypothetical protein [Vibrio cholerae]HDZ9245449.1 hypothetical protein [Vibrio cholerae]HDZ9467454.1 hypothetical protein [Vibrio cholerae]
MVEESKSKRNFKAELIKKLPFFPDDRNTLQQLESEGLGNVMFYYLHWSTRQVPSRVRKVHIYPELTADKRYKMLKEQIKLFRNKVSNGEDLSPYLSLKAHKKGYTPRQRIIDGKADSWEDKDQILNTKGFHHFHLAGLPDRTNEVLFAKVTRTEFHAVAIFDHSVFEPADENGNLELERKRMWDIHDKYATMGLPPGTVYMTSPIASSGHPLCIKSMANRYMQTIKQYDSKLSDRNFVNQLYKNGNLLPPERYKLEWQIDALDLVIFDKKNNVKFTVYQGYL